MKPQSAATNPAMVPPQARGQGPSATGAGAWQGQGGPLPGQGRTAPAAPRRPWLDQAVAGTVALALVGTVSWCLAWWWPHQWRQALWLSVMLAVALAWAWVRWLPCASRLGRLGQVALLVCAAAAPPWPAYQHWLAAQSAYPVQFHAFESQLESLAQRALDLHAVEAPTWPAVTWELPRSLRVLERATKLHALSLAQDEWQWRQTMQSVQMDRLLAAGRLQTEDGLRAVQAQLAQVTQLARGHQQHQRALAIQLQESLHDWAAHDGADSPLRHALGPDLQRMTQFREARWEGELSVLAQLEQTAQWLQSQSGRWQIRNDTLVFLHAATLQEYRDRQQRLVQAQEAQRERLQGRKPGLWQPVEEEDGH